MATSINRVMFRFIHTSDWHLGQNFYGYDRSEEQRDFLRQLADIVSAQQPDALLVSGDIYHTAAPASSTVSMYVEAMLDIHEACPGMAIIVIAGNHDSAARLDSDSLLWQRAGVNVLGGVARDTDGNALLDRHLIHVGDSGIVAAVPFCYPGAFPQIKEGHAVREQRQQAFFQALLERADSVNPQGLPVVLMAHLAVTGSDFTGHDGPMMMDSVALDSLGTGYDFAALGHIHRQQQLSDRARYCGTPLAVSFDEQCEHSVSLVEIDAHRSLPVIRNLPIKNLKPLHTIPARLPVDFETVMNLLYNIDGYENAYVRLNVLIDGKLPHDAQTRAATELEKKNCRFCCIKRTLPPGAGGHPPRMSLEELTAKRPIDVADRFFKDKTGDSMNVLQREMFNEAYQQVLTDIREQ